MKKYKILVVLLTLLLSVSLLFACDDDGNKEESGENGQTTQSTEEGTTSEEKQNDPSEEGTTSGEETNPSEEKQETWTISFNQNGGTEPMAPVTVLKGENYILPSCTMVAPIGKEFDCWNYDGTNFAVGSSLSVSKDITLKAIWKNKKFTLSFDANGGTGAPEPKTVEYKTRFELPYCTMTPPDGEEFLCWEINGEGKQPGDVLSIRDDTVIKALWTGEKLTAQEYVSNIVNSYPCLELTDYQMPDNAKMANDEYLGQVILFHGESDIDKYANVLKEDGFQEEAGRTTDRVTLVIEDLDEGVRITVTIEYVSESNAVRVKVEDDPCARYTLQNLPTNFKIGFSSYGVPWTMYYVNGDFYITDGYNVNYYFRSYIGTMFEIYTHRPYWCGWALETTIEKTELFDYLAKKEWEDPIKILGYKAYVNYTCDKGCTETFLEKSCKKYTSRERIGEGEYSYNEVFYTDRETNLTLFVQDVYDDELYNSSSYEADSIQIGDVTMPVFDPALDAPIVFPTEQLKDTTGYDGFPDYAETSVWMYSYRESGSIENGYEVDVYGASGEGYGAYYGGLEEDGYKITFKNGTCYADKKDTDAMKVYHVILYFRNGSYQEGIKGNILYLTYYAETYIPSSWPLSDITDIPPFVTEKGEYTKYTNYVNRTDGWGRSSVQVTVADYTQAELATWKTQLLAADAGKLWEGHENEYYLEGKDCRRLLVLSENADKSLITVTIFGLSYRLTAPNALLKQAIPDIDIPIFTFETAYYKYEYVGWSQRHSNVTGKYYDMVRYDVEIRDNGYYLSDEKVAEMVAFLQEDTNYVYISYDHMFVRQTTDKLYMINCSSSGYAIYVGENISEYYWDNSVAKAKGETVASTPDFEYMHDASYMFDYTNEKLWTLEFECRGALYGDYTNFCCGVSGTPKNPDKPETVIEDDDLGKCYQRWLQQKTLLGCVEHETFYTYTYEVWEIYIKYIDYTTYFFLSIEYYQMTQNVDKE